MRLLFLLTAALVALFSPALHADIEMRISVKFILDEAGNYPSGATSNTDISSPTLFAAEITRANATLERTGRGYSIRVVGFSYIIPPVPNGQPGDYWFNLDARTNRATIEAAALADQPVWDWEPGAVNIYVNNSTSGQCSFSGAGFSIALGSGIAGGTVLHELGHFFDLRHTHPGDYDFTVDDWGDGDGLAETLTDDADASIAQVNAFHAAQPVALRNDLINNVMSYHNELELLGVQMDRVAETANGVRFSFVNGRTVFVATNGNDNNAPSTAANPVRTVQRGHARVNSLQPADIILLRAGNYAENLILDKACTLRTAGGIVTIGQP